MIKLKSNDDHVVEVTVGVAKMFGLIKNMIDNQIGEDEDDHPVPLPNVRGEVLDKVVEYAKYHHEDPPPDEDDTEKKNGEISPWDAKFLEPLDQSTLFDVILAANYLDLKGLLDVACQKVANTIKSKSVEEVREMLELENDFTPEEEAKILEENKWAETS